MGGGADKAEQPPPVAAGEAQAPRRHVVVREADGSPLENVLLMPFTGDVVLEHVRTGANGTASLDVDGPAQLAVVAEGRPVLVTALSGGGSTMRSQLHKRRLICA